jgi:hypothetical protein
MAAHSGNLSHSFPTSIESHIIVGNGAGLPISHIGSTSFPSSSRPLSLNNVIVSPHLIQNLVSIKALSRDDSVTVEFDTSGFSVKDGHTRMVLRRCESPGDLYLVQASSTPTPALALSLLASIFGMLILDILVPTRFIK